MNVRNHILRGLGLVTVAAMMLLVSSDGALVAQSPSSGMPDLVGALKGTPGCLGVELAQTASGKQVIFAWFENKKAVLNWYYSETHQKVMQTFFHGRSSGRTPLSAIADDSGPILAIASLTLSDKPQFGATSLPVSQIAIELYGPLPGGLALGGRFAPDTVKVLGLLESAMRRARPTSSGERTSATVRVEIVGARSAKGKLGVALFQAATGFPEDASKAVRREEVDIDAQTLNAAVVFSDVPPGGYAIAVRHDENLNGKLDTGLFGRPTEGYGTSNNTKAMFRAPRYDEAKFQVSAAEQTIQIRLIY